MTNTSLLKNVFYAHESFGQKGTILVRNNYREVTNGKSGK